jgi:hypothetical protein
MYTIEYFGVGDVTSAVSGGTNKAISGSGDIIKDIKDEGGGYWTEFDINLT